MFQPSLKLTFFFFECFSQAFLYTVVFKPVAFLPDERGCANLLRKMRWTRYNRIICIYCHSQNIKKNGCYRSNQKFYCKCCKKNFNDKTDTIFHYSHTPLKKWFIVLYLFFVLWPGCSIMETSLLIFHITYATDLLELLWRRL